MNEDIKVELRSEDNRIDLNEASGMIKYEEEQSSGADFNNTEEKVEGEQDSYVQYIPAINSLADRNDLSSSEGSVQGPRDFNASFMGTHCSIFRSLSPFFFPTHATETVAMHSSSKANTHNSHAIGRAR